MKPLRVLKLLRVLRTVELMGSVLSYQCVTVMFCLVRVGYKHETHNSVHIIVIIFWLHKNIFVITELVLIATCCNHTTLSI